MYTRYSQSVLNSTGSSDFEKLQPVQTRGASVDIKLITIDDDIALEYDDTVTLQFNPQDPQKILQLKAAGEFIRDTAVLNIIDNDRKLSLYSCYIALHYF